MNIGGANLFSKLIDYHADNEKTEIGTFLSLILGLGLGTCLIVGSFEKHIISSGLMATTYLSIAILLFILTGISKYNSYSNRTIAIAGSFLWFIALPSLLIYWIGWLVLNFAAIMFQFHSKIGNIKYPKVKTKIGKGKTPSAVYRDAAETCNSCGQFLTKE